MYLNELKKYCKNFNNVYQIWDNHPDGKNVDSDYNEKIAAIVFDRNVKRLNYLKTIPFSDFKAFELILKNLQKNSNLHIGNSSPIRYTQLFTLDKSIEVFCNRGTSGIDGSTSTAIGAAVASNKPTLLITGDVSFFYDSNALWNEYIPKNFKIIVINNGGGGIFRILPGHQEIKIFTTYFETSHCLTAEHLAKMYRFDYFTASSETTLKDSLKLFLNNEKQSLLEVFTPTKKNDIILKEYFKALV
jgi:2-succinyl-5-enolpyruvyl-6-hydroxy-3-cyclohexene-1-carboxylate synthase